MPFYRKIIKWWVCSRLPDEHIFGKKTNNDSKGYIRKWFLHPIKRRMAKYYLFVLKRTFGVNVIAITGSAGKTTTKEMLTAILSYRGNVIASYKNIDPVYNIPTTIFKCRPSTKYLILEMGVEFPGEMDFYLWLTQPDIAVITNVYPTHTEFFGDLHGVFKEKRKLAESIRTSGAIILNNENDYLRSLKEKVKGKVILFGKGGNVTSSEEKIINGGTRFKLLFDNPKKNILITIPTYGKQFVYDSLAASSVAKYLGFSIDEIKIGLERYIPQEHRMTIFKHGSGATIIDDTYNNNPQAAIEALNSLIEYSGSKDRVVIFGDMLELGKLDKLYHDKLGTVLAKSDLKKLICIGKSVVNTAKVAAKIIGNSKVNYFKDKDDALKIIIPYLNSKTVILVKGSRSLNLENLVNRILNQKSDKM
jgi:UDP-N-acetylmuramoyl-tripeptide--D-alanyl-D-alanine ligase